MTIYYPDISSFQGNISLKGTVAVAAKATQGTGYTSPFFGSQRGNAGSAGAFFMAYHFLEAGNGSGQASHAHAVAGKAPMMLDFEPSTSHPGMGDAISFIDTYRRLGGICNLVYLPHWYWQQIGSPSLKPFMDRHMALVSSAYSTYTNSDSGVGWQSYGGMKPEIWQYTDSMLFNGQRVDFNAYRGSYAGKQDSASVKACLDQFKRRALGTKAPAPKPEPTPPPTPKPTPQEEQEMPVAIKLPETIGESQVMSWPAGSVKGFSIVTDEQGSVTFSVSEFHTQPDERWLEKKSLTTSGRAVSTFDTPDDCTAVRVTLTKGKGSSSFHTFT